MSKLIMKAKKSKLFDTFSRENDKSESENILRKNSSNEFPKSFRLDTETLNILKETQDRINSIAPKKISESRIIRALILISKSINDDKLIKALKDTW